MELHPSLMPLCPIWFLILHTIFLFVSPLVGFEISQDGDISSWLILSWLKQGAKDTNKYAIAAMQFFLF